MKAHRIRLIGCGHAWMRLCIYAMGVLALYAMPCMPWGSSTWNAALTGHSIQGLQGIQGMTNRVYHRRDDTQGRGHRTQHQGMLTRSSHVIACDEGTASRVYSSACMYMHQPRASPVLGCSAGHACINTGDAVQDMHASTQGMQCRTCMHWNIPAGHACINTGGTLQCHDGHATLPLLASSCQ